MSADDKNRVLQIFSLSSLANGQAVIDASPIWAIEINAEARHNGALRYLVFSSFNHQLVISIENGGRELFLASILAFADKWLVTAEPQQLLQLFMQNDVQTLPQMVDFLLPGKLLTGGQITKDLPTPKLPAGIDELSKICRLAYFYLHHFCLKIDSLEKNGLTRVFQVECALMAVLSSISYHGLFFSTPIWENNKKAQVSADEQNKWNTAVGLVERDLIPRLDSDGRLHSHFDPLGAATGRISSNNPNLQSIPGHDLIRQCFTAPSGSVIISADYSAAELRILAQLSQEPLFLQAFAQGLDFHSYIAKQVFGVEVSKTIHPELRKQAKVINFGLAYGMGAGGLANAANISLKEAEDLLHQYKETMPTLFGYLKNSASEAIKRGYAETIIGRRRDLSALSGNEAERIARNTPIQGSCADIIKIALIKIFYRLKDCCPAAHIVNTIHDEIVLEVPEELADQVATITKVEMAAAAGALLPDVPMAADVNINSYWQH